MIGKRLTCKHDDGGAAICLNGRERFVRTRSREEKIDFMYGDAADKLHAYEELGYEPEELHVIIKRFRALQEVYDSRPKDNAFDNFKADLLQSCIYSYVMNDIKSTGEAWTALSKTIKNVIFNEPATIVFWLDGTKTVVKVQEGDTFDPEKGLAMAIAKKFFGNKGNYCNEIKKWTEKYEEPEEPDAVTINMSFPNMTTYFKAINDFNKKLKKLKNRGVTEN